MSGRLTAAALPIVVNAIVQNAGQTCSAGSRLLVERGCADELLDKLGARFASLKVGPALADPDPAPGDPSVRPDLPPRHPEPLRADA